MARPGRGAISRRPPPALERAGRDRPPFWGCRKAPGAGRGNFPKGPREELGGVGCRGRAAAQALLWLV